MAASDWRPDPAEGVFETLLVVDGEAVELDGHLARLQRSLREIYGTELPSRKIQRTLNFRPDGESNSASAEFSPGDTVERAGAAAAGHELGRLRLTATPAGDGVEFEIGVRPIDQAIMFPSAGSALRRVNRPGGHGPHKWVDRRGMEHPTGGPGQLICDGGEVLEAGWANVFAVRQETLWTPATDGRILAGMARAAVLEIADEEGLEASEAPLPHDDLRDADEVFLTNSIRGIEPAIELDGSPLAGCGKISHRLADALRRRWGLPNAAGDLEAPAAAPIPGQPAR